MINNNLKKPAVKVASEKQMLYPAEKGASYSHSPFICRFRNRFFVSWSNGIENEEDCGQGIRMTRSCDGKNWEDPFFLIRPEALGNPEATLVNGGFYVTEKQLVLYFGFYYYDPKTLTVRPDRVIRERPPRDADHLGTAFYAMTTEDGDHWSAPIPMHIRLAPNHSPFTTSSGRLIIPGNIMYPYSDDPSGLGRFTPTGIYQNAFADEEPWDDSDAIMRVAERNAWPLVLCESSVYETDDRVLHMLIRSNSDYMWYSESRDDGTTWSDPSPTAFAFSPSKFKCGRLPDKRFYCVCNPVPGSPRNPLSICLSEDGENFDTAYILRDENTPEYDMTYPGMFKGFMFAYPDTLIFGDEMYIVYSIQKEKIELSRVKLSDLK